LELSIEGATGVLYNITGGIDLSMNEVDKAAQLIKEAVDPSANVIFGVTIDPENPADELSITMVATGFDESKQVYSRRRRDETVDVREESKKSSANIDDLISEDSDSPVSKPKGKVVQEDDEEMDEVPAFMRKKK
jgi:cell division protein FtsZ